MDRFIAIKSPLRAKRVNSVKQATFVVIGLVITAFAITVNRLVDYYWFIANDAGIGPLPLRPAFLERWRLVYTWLLVSRGILRTLAVSH